MNQIVRQEAKIELPISERVATLGSLLATDVDFLLREKYDEPEVPQDEAAAVLVNIFSYCEELRREGVEVGAEQMKTVGQLVRRPLAGSDLTGNWKGIYSDTADIIDDGKPIGPEDVFEFSLPPVWALKDGKEVLISRGRISRRSTESSSPRRTPAKG